MYKIIIEHYDVDTEDSYHKINREEIYTQIIPDAAFELMPIIEATNARGRVLLSREKDL